MDDWTLDVEDAVEALEEAVGPDGRPSWAAWHWDGDGPELHQHPEDLVGLLAPPWVVAVGIASGGRAHDLTGRTAPRRCRIACVVARDGRVASRMRVGDELIAEPPSEGRTLDTLRRCLGVATGAPQAPLRGAVVLLLWLQALSDADRPGGRRLRWADAAALHPAAAVAAGEGVEALVEAGDELGWEELRLLAACGAATLRGIAPEVAAWMDEGMLAREVLGSATAEGALGRAVRAVDTRTRSRIEAAIGLLARSSPDPGRPPAVGAAAAEAPGTPPCGWPAGAGADQPTRRG